MKMDGGKSDLVGEVVPGVTLLLLEDPDLEARQVRGEQP